MVAAIEDRLPAEERRAAFHGETAHRLELMNKNGKGVLAAEVFDYLRKRVHGKSAVRPKPRKIA
jgi:hypothetical protein